MERIEVNLDDTDAQIIAALVEHFDRQGKSFESSRTAEETGLPTELVEERLKRFWRYEMVKPLNRGGRWSIQPPLLSVARQLSAPEPEPDRIEEFTRRFRSKRYAVPLWLLGVVIPAVVLPAVVGWVAIIRWLLAN